MKILEISTERRHIGNLGEKYAAIYLFLHGYRILAKNFVAKDAEIDIVAKKKKLIAFVEVKTQTIGAENIKKSRPSAAVDQKKQKKIIKAASYFSDKKLDESRKRFDVIEVYLTKTKKGYRPSKIIHMVGAFDLNTAYEKNTRQLP